MSVQLTLAVMLAITLAAAIFVAWPLLFGRTRPEEFFEGERNEPLLQRLLFQRDTVYAAMKELEFDLAMGNLSQQDFQQLQERYKKKALAILKRIDDAKAGRLRQDDIPEARDDFLAEDGYPGRTASRRDSDDTELDVEQEIQSYRSRARGRSRDGRVSSEKLAATCPSCGRKVTDPEAAFCSKCGAPIRRRG